MSDPHMTVPSVGSRIIKPHTFCHDARNERPIKLSYTNSSVSAEVLRKGRELKGTDKFSSVFIRPDRSPEQRVAQRQLVIDFKSKLRDEPHMRHYIRGDQIISVAKID